MRLISFYSLLDGSLGYDNFVYLSVTGFCMFTGFFFFSYYIMVLRGWTIIEAAERFANLRKKVRENINIVKLQRKAAYGEKSLI